MQRALAIAHFRAALQLNPMLFTAYEALCALGTTMLDYHVLALIPSGHDALPEDVFVDEASASILRSANATPGAKQPQSLHFETPAYVKF